MGALNMPDRTVTARTLIKLDQRSVFDWVADFRNVPRVLPSVIRWQPVGVGVRGVGARFDVAMRAFGLPLTGEVVLDDWDEPKSIGWHSVSGLIQQRGTWAFRAGPQGTLVVLTITYAAPAGPGSFLASRVENTLKNRLERALLEMRDLLEES